MKMSRSYVLPLVIFSLIGFSLAVIDTIKEAKFNKETVRDIPIKGPEDSNNENNHDKKFHLIVIDAAKEAKFNEETARDIPIKGPEDSNNENNHDKKFHLIVIDATKEAKFNEETARDIPIKGPKDSNNKLSLATDEPTEKALFDEPTKADVTLEEAPTKPDVTLEEAVFDEPTKTDVPLEQAQEANQEMELAIEDGIGKTFLKNNKDHLYDWKIFITRLRKMYPEILGTKNGRITLKHMWEEIETIIRVTKGKVLKTISSEFRNVMLNETAKGSIIKIADTVQKVLVTKNGFSTAFKKIESSCRIIFDHKMVKAGQILATGIQDLKGADRFAYLLLKNMVI